MIKNLKKQLFNKNNNKEENESDPISIVPINNSKHIKNTDEIYLGFRNINKISNFQIFSYIEILWLNNNKIETISGLKNNFRLKELYIHDNLISNLKGDLTELKNLKILSIYNNKLLNLENSILYLKKLIYLEELLIFNNPLMEEPNSRAKFIFYLKTLKNFNRQKLCILDYEKSKIIIDKENNLNYKNNKIEKKKVLKNFQIVSKTEQLLNTTYKKLQIEKNKINSNNIETLKEQKLTGGLLDYKLEAKKFELEPYEKIKFLPYFKTKSSNDLKLPVNILNEFYDKFKNDDFELVKLPDISKEDFVNNLIKLTDNQPISWIIFKKYLNNFKWINIKKEDVKEKIEELYKKSQLLFNQNKKEESFKILEKAMLLDNKSI